MEICIGLSNYGVPPTNRSEKGKSIIAVPNQYCVVDIETTGLSTQWNHIIEIAAIRYVNGEEKDRFQTLIKPYEDEECEWVDDYITELTGITNEMLREAPLTESAMQLFVDFLGDDIIVGYNVNFDINFLYDNCMEHLNCPLRNDFIDAMRMARKLYPNEEHHRLADMVRILGIDTKTAHRALADVESTQECFKLLINEAEEQYSSMEQFIDSFKKKHTRSHSQLDARMIQGNESKNDPDSPLYLKYCVFTGTLERMTRQQAMQIVADLGGINENNVTKKTNYLILGNNDYCKTIRGGKSNKQKKAEESRLKGQDIEIIPETVFYDMLGDELR